ncbi:hypothetical protein B9Z19DRAFT_1121639 [Tuber borchii]|uniref:Uncharacterized protein n=1 Tax=Tuber borchii TaxID=42251 RepID=A0A2T7A296_TUBBO|nr:hypothetical protein B9Z19DRAFT_1121639 [Tuber borchii]
MAPRSGAIPKAMAFLRFLFSAISSFIKSKFKSKKKKGWGFTRTPIIVPPSEWPEGFEFLNVDMGTQTEQGFEFLDPDSVDMGTQTEPFPPPQNPSPELPAGFELKPAGPEKVPWVELPDLQKTDEYEELTSNRWNYNRKRSIEAQEPIMKMMERAGIHAHAQQQSQGEACLLYSKELSLSVSIFLIIVFMCAAAVLVFIITRRKVCRRIISLAELGEVKGLLGGNGRRVNCSVSKKFRI